MDGPLPIGYGAEAMGRFQQVSGTCEGAVEAEDDCKLVELSSGRVGFDHGIEVIAAELLDATKARFRESMNTDICQDRENRRRGRDNDVWEEVTVMKKPINFEEYM